MAPRVELRACSKRFGERVALRRVTVTVAPGETVALVGANGSGKSTLLRIVAGLTRPTVGEALIDGVPAAALATASRGVVGYLGHRALAYRGLSARENLTLLADLHGLPRDRVAAALHEVGLADRGDDRIDGFSRGMLQRLSLGRTYLHAPTLVLLDEPTTGLDAEGLATLDALIAARRGTATTLISTHDEGFAARHADRAVRLVAGEVAP
jgi:heme ABC exporter ATP-binding subunit CcmA